MGNGGSERLGICLEIRASASEPCCSQPQAVLLCQWLYVDLSQASLPPARSLGLREEQPQGCQGRLLKEAETQQEAATPESTSGRPAGPSFLFRRSGCVPSKELQFPSRPN